MSPITITQPLGLAAAVSGQALLAALKNASDFTSIEDAGWEDLSRLNHLNEPSRTVLDQSVSFIAGQRVTLPDVCIRLASNIATGDDWWRFVLADASRSPLGLQAEESYGEGVQLISQFKSRPTCREAEELAKRIRWYARRVCDVIRRG